MRFLASLLLFGCGLSIVAAPLGDEPHPAPPPVPIQKGDDDEPIYRVPPGELVPLFIEELYQNADVADWGHQPLAVPRAWEVSKGKGVKVAVLDTGIDAAHRDIKDQVLITKDFTRSRNGAADVQGHGCVAPTDMLYTSISGLDTAENIYNKASGPRIPDAVADIKDVRAANIYTVSADPKTGKPVRAKVQAVHKLHHTGKMYEVETREGKLTLTPWHPVYVITSCRGTNLSIKKVRADEIRSGDKILLNGVCEDVCDYQTVNGVFVDEDAAFWLGLVASDGHVMKLQKSVSFSNTDRNQGDQYCNLSESLFYKRPSEYKYERRSAYDWRLHDKAAWEFAVACGIPAGDKSRTLRVPEVIKRSPRSVVMAFVAGMLEGDGNIRERVRLATGSKELANELSLLLKMLGVHSSVSEVAPSWSENPSYCVRIGSDDELVEQMRVKDTGKLNTPKPRVSASVTSVTVKDYDGPVYDLTVEGTHVYACNGHIVSNTHCAGVVAAAENGTGMVGVAPEAKLIIGKVLGDNGSGSSYGIALGIRWATDEGADVISMSLGGGSPDADTQAAVKYATERGVIVVAAAGNEGPGEQTVAYPGGYPECVCVGAIDDKLNVARFSSRGKQLYVAAPGVNVRSCYPGDRFATMSGTSMATPYVAGVAGLFCAANPNLAKVDRPAAFRKALVDTVIDLGPSGRDTAYGFGLVQPAKMLGNTNPMPPMDPPTPKPPTKIRFGFDDFTDSGKEKLKLLNPDLESIEFTLKPKE